MTMSEIKAQIKTLDNKFYKTPISDWQTRAQLAREGFRLSAEIAKTVVPAEKHGIVDKIVETLLNNRGNGWFADKYGELVITTSDPREIAKHVANWLTKAREAGLVLS